MPSIGGCRGTGRFAHQQLKDREGKGFVVGCARDKLRLEEQPSPRQPRTLRRWSPAKAPRTWARGATPRSATLRVANSFFTSPLKSASLAMKIHALLSKNSPGLARRPRLTGQADAPRRALPEPLSSFSRASNPSAWRSGKARGKGGGAERKPSFSLGFGKSRMRGQEMGARTLGETIAITKHSITP